MLEALRARLKTAAINPKLLFGLLGLGGAGALAAWGIPKAQAAVSGWNQNIGGRNDMMQNYINSMNNVQAPIGGLLPRMRMQAQQNMTGQ